MHINDYMKSNFLHINLEKCCYIHFKPKNFKDDMDDYEIDECEESINISGFVIPEVQSTKFLGVIIDNNLCWLPHIEFIHKKLRSACGMLKRMRHNIPKEHYRSLYFALFESHLSYCITVFGNANKSYTERLFITQKNCLRILFGNLEAFLEKFKTCSRTRSIENQILGHDFYKKEHTKPIFHQQKILAFKNLYNYQICLEMLKILKFHIPYCLYDQFTLSSRNNESILLARPNQGNYVNERLGIWNNCIKTIIGTETLLEVNIQSFKTKLKTKLLNIQNAFDPIEWCPDKNSFK